MASPEATTSREIKPFRLDNIDDLWTLLDNCTGSSYSKVFRHVYNAQQIRFFRLVKETRLSTPQVATVLKRFKKVGILETDKDGLWRVSNNFYSVQNRAILCSRCGTGMEENETASPRRTVKERILGNYIYSKCGECGGPLVQSGEEQVCQTCGLVQSLEK